MGLAQLAPRFRSPGFAAVLLAGALTTLLAAGGAVAGPTLSRDRADTIATRVLRPQADKGEVILFGLSKPLPAGTIVVPADPARGRLGRRVRQRVKPLTSSTWLYWLDRVPDAAFSHPSEYLLIDDRTGRVTRRAAIGWYPTVNGKAPAFLSSDTAYESARYRVYARLSRATTRKGASVAAAKPPSVVPKEAFKHDCILMVGDYHGPGFTQDFTALSQWGASAGVRSFYTTQGGPTKDAPPKNEVAPSGSTLRTNVDTLVDKLDCTDVLLFVDGHGEPEEAGPPTVISSNNVAVEVDGRVEKYTVGITAEDIETNIKRHPTIGFKLKVNSCYSGRFLDELAPGGKPKLKNLLIAEAAAGAGEASYFGRDTYQADGKTKKARPDNPDDLSEFVNQNVTGLYTWASSQTEVAASVASGGSLLANALERAFVLGRPANAAIKWDAHPVIVRGEAGEPVKVSVNTFDLGTQFKTAWIPAWVDNGTPTGAMVFTDRAGNQVGALDPRTGATQVFPLNVVTSPNGVAPIDPFRFAVAGYGGVAIFDRTPPGKITELQLAGTRLVNLAVGRTSNLYVTDIQNNQFITIRPPYAGPANVTRTPLPTSCLRPTGIVPTQTGLTVLCQQSNNVVSLGPGGNLQNSFALPTPNVGAQEPHPTGRGGIVFSGFGANRLYHLRAGKLQSVATGRGPAVSTVVTYPDTYDDLFASRTTHVYAFVPQFTAGGASTAEFNATAASAQLPILAGRNLVGSGIGPGCSPWVADGTPGKPTLYRIRFPVQGAPTNARAEGKSQFDYPMRCSDFTDAARTHKAAVRIPRGWQQAKTIEFGMVGYRGDPWRSKATFSANFPVQLTVESTGGAAGKPRVSLKQTGADTAVATVTGIPAKASTVTLTITSKGTDAPFGLLTAARARR